MSEILLKRLAKQVIEDHGSTLDHLTIVLPSERASLFFKSYLAEQLTGTIWAPKVTSINAFIESYCPYQIIDQLNLQFEFFEAYRAIEKEHAESFEQTIGWSATFLSDLNEIERYLVPADKLFTDLKNIKDIEGWTLGEDELTEGQLRYTSFWQKLGTYRTKLHERLAEQGKMYAGQAYRHLADRIDEVVLDTLDASIYLAGFNALSASEEKVISSLVRAGKARIFWDADSYYLNNEDHEAGLFLRRYAETWAAGPKWVSDDLMTDEKSVNFIGVPQHVLQAKVAGDLVKKIQPGADETCAIVLADETLISPLLNSLPDTELGYNITMGYALHNSPLHAFLMALVNLHQNMQRYSKGRVYHRDLVSVVLHPYFIKLITSTQPEFVQELNEQIIKRNRIYLSPPDLTELIKDDELRATLFNDLNGSAKQMIQRLIAATGLLSEVFRENEAAKLDLEYVYEYIKILNRLKDLFTDYEHDPDLRAFKSIFSRLVRGTSLSFFGEPLRGAQILGMLETRALDFEHVILLSANEGVLPKMKMERSYIPFDLKRYYQLPTHHEKEAIYANHFYHLIQRARNVHILYNTEADDLGGGERSRYLLQLEEELTKVNPGIRPKTQVLSLPVHGDLVPEFVIANSETVRSRLLEWMRSGISPSALNSFMGCPLDFYYKYVIGLRNLDEVEESVEASSFGTFVHDTLEELYRPVVGRKLDKKDLQRMHNEKDGALRAAFRKRFSERDLDSGKNLIALKVAERYVGQFLEQEAEELSAGNVIEIVSLEEELEYHTTVDLGGQKEDILLKGKADRIDRHNGTIRVIDYKTGEVKPSNLKIDDLEKLGTESKLAKARQVMLYGLLYARNHPELPSLNSGVVSFRNLEERVILAKADGSTELNEATFSVIEEQLNAVIQYIYSCEGFSHDPDAKYCEHCE